MRRVEHIVEDLKDYSYEKSVLEVACGDADLSLAVSARAAFVCGIDVSLVRIT